MRTILTFIAVVIASVMVGMIAGNLGMWGYSVFVLGFTPPVRHQPIDIIIAAYSSMIGCGLAGFYIGRIRRKAGGAP